MMRKLFYMGMVTTMDFYEKQVYTCDSRENGIRLLRKWNACLNTEMIVPRKSMGRKATAQEKGESARLN